MTLLSVCLFLVIFAFARTRSTSIEELNDTDVIVLATESPSKDIKKDGDKCDADSLNTIVCEKDRLQFCGPNNQIMSIPCVLNGRQAFCNCEKTACVPQKPICSDEKNECLVPNTKLPVSEDCHKFTYCNKNNEKLTLQCPGNLIYDPRTEKCTDGSTARCSRIVCPRPGKELQLIPFPQAKNYYVLCYNGVGDVRKCADEHYAVRNNVCQFDCSLKGTSGVFKDTNLNRCKKGIYYGCRKVGASFTTAQAKCSTGQTFDEKFGICTEEDTCSETKKTP